MYKRDEMKKTNKNSRKKLLNFLNEGEIRVGKGLDSLVDRFAMTNSKSRAGDIGEEIAVRYLKEECNYSISRNANLDFKNDMPFADVWGIDSKGVLSLVSVKASSTIYAANNNALANSNVKLKSVYSMLKYLGEDYDNFYNRVVSKLNNRVVSKLKTPAPPPVDNADIDLSTTQEEDLQEQLSFDSSQNFEIPVKLGIMAIDLGPSKRVYNAINKEIENIASYSKIEDMGSLKDIANKHNQTFEVRKDENLYSISQRNRGTKIEFVKDFMDSMAHRTAVSSPFFKAWRAKRVNSIIEEKYGKNNNAYIMLRFFEKEVRFSISSSSSNTKIEIVGDINKDDKITNGTQANSKGFKVSSKPSFRELKPQDFVYIGSKITLEDAAGSVGYMTAGRTMASIEDDDDISMYSDTDADFTILSNRSVRNELYRELNDLLYYYLDNEDFKQVIAKAKEIVKSNHGLTVESVIAKSLSKLLIEKKKRRRSKCTPARRRINSGGKAGSYADPRTGGKQAYAALKKAKPPGSRGGWTKKKCICCHKCPNDRSAPNGFVCTNPSHLYWGTKADNTYDQNRGNGWAARNKKKNEGDPNGKGAFAYELMISEDKVRSLIEKILKEDLESESWFGESFVNFKTAVSRGKDPLAYAKDNLREIGRGSTRVVFDFPDNPGVVLKIINTEVEKASSPFIDADGNIMPEIGPEGDRRTKHGFFKNHMRQSNEWEADLIMQQKFPDIFPRTFEKADDFSWILAEKARPVASMEELIRILGVTDNFARPKSIKKIQFIRMIQDGIDYFKDPDHPLRKINESPETTIDIGLLGDDPRDTMPLVGDTIRDSQLGGDTVANQVQKSYVRTETREDKRLRELISSSHNRAILGAMADLDIPSREFLPKNMGVSEISGKLLIIDASLWEEKKQVR